MMRVVCVVVVFSSAAIIRPTTTNLGFWILDFVISSVRIQFNFIERETQYVGYASSVFRKVIIELCFFD